MSSTSSHSSVHNSSTPNPTPQTIEISVLFFARSRELAGTNAVELSVPAGCTVQQLVLLLLSKFPELTELVPSSVLAVNHQYVDGNSEHQLKEGDEVAFIPPISGG